MKRFFLMLAMELLLVSAAGTTATAAVPQKRSQNIVYIDGKKYYIHIVEAGETLSSIGRLYATSEDELLRLNPTAGDGLKSDQTLKIPFAGSSTERVMSKKEIKEQKKNFTEHIIAPGETLYGIARRYEISVEILMEDNPDADPLHLSIGGRLWVRKKAIGHTDEQTTQAELSRYEEMLNRLSGQEAYRYHLVQPKETIYSLARRYGISEEELISLNNLEGVLKRGTILRIPNPEASAPVIEQIDSLLTDSLANLLPNQPRVPRELLLKALTPAQRLKVALLLPLTIEGRANRNVAAFYQGFLIGLEEVKSHGYSVDAMLYDTKRSLVEVERIVNESDFREAHLIVGPIYADGIEPILRYAEQAEIPVVTPLADLSVCNSDVLFQMAPTDAHKYDKLQPLLEADATITLIRTKNNDSEFEQEILQELAGRNYQYYDYESVQGVEHAERSDLTPLLKEHDKHLFFVLSDNEVDVDRILASFASAQTNMQARSQRVPEFTVVGSTRWNRYTNIDRTTFFKNRVVLFSIFHAKRDAEQVRQFDTRYIQAFGAMPTLYSYRGYETAMIFCPGMFSDIEYNMEGRRYHPLQTSYTFGREGESLTHINREWVKVTYNPDFTISVE